MTRALRAAVLLAVCAVTTVAAREGSLRPITEIDLFKFVWIGDARVSPDGRRVAFVRVTVNEKDDSYDTALWVVPADGASSPRQLTSGTRDSSPRWSPDGRQLAFLRVAMKDDRPQPAQIYLLDMNGGEARQLTSAVRGAGAPAWSPDGKAIAFTSNTSPKDLEKREGATTSGRATCA